MFKGRWSRKRFTISILISIVAYIALTIGFPLALMAVASASNCASGNGACGAVALVFSMMAKPLIYGLFLLSLIAPLMGRLRDIGVSPWLSLFVVALVVADNAFLLYGGAPWSFGFSAGVLRIDPPIFLATALALMVVLAILPPREGRLSLRTLGWLAWPALAIAAVVMIPTLYRLAWSFPGLVGKISPVTQLFRYAIVYGVYMLPLLPVAAGFALWPRAGQTVEVSAQRGTGPRLPLIQLAFAALGMAIVLTLFLGPNGIDWIWAFMLPAAMVPMVLPNAVLFFLVLLAITLWVKRPSWIAGLLTVALIAIYGTWGYQLYLSAHISEIDERDLAAVETYEPAVMPRAILVDAGGHGTMHAIRSVVLERSDFETIVVKEGTKLTGYRRIPPEQQVINPKTKIADRLALYDVTAMPEPHLVFKASNHSSFYHRGDDYVGDSPFELRIIEGDSDRLVAVWYRRQIDMPLWLPVLTTNGWRPGGGNRPYVDRDDVGRAFLVSALGEATPVPRAAVKPARVETEPAVKKKRPTLMDLLFGGDTKMVEDAPERASRPESNGWPASK